MIDVQAYLAGKGYRGRQASGGRELIYPCFFDCGEAPDSRKRKLYIQVEEGVYNCKVCNASGGSYTLQKHFGDDPKSGSTDDPFTRRRILDWAAAVGAEMLANRDDVLLYLINERGLDPQTIVDRQLGFVGDGWSLTGSLPEHFTRDQLKQTGLVWKDGARVGDDFFRQHLLIPIISRGHVIQIRGRVWGETRGGKYLSGPGEVVRAYNVDSLDGADEVILTEGEFDCYSGDTEVFTRNGWVRFDEYQPGDEVLQYAADGSLAFVRPSGFIADEGREFLRLASAKRGGIDLVVTPGHRMVATLLDGTGLKIHRADDRPSSRYHLPRVGWLDGPGVDMSPDEMALILAVSADASIDRRHRDGAQYVRFGFSKQRKIDRLVGILERLGVEYSHRSLASGVHSICFRVPNYLNVDRRLPMQWLTDASREQREFLLRELVEWDGNRVAGRDMFEYSSKHSESADWVQALAHTTGRVATIQARTSARGSWFKVSILHGKRSTSWQSITTTEASVQTAYCVEVPSGMLLVRRAGQVAVSGNCMRLYEVLQASTEQRVRRIAVVGLPGTNAFPDDLEDRLSEVKRIYVGFDSDEPGRVAAEKLRDKYGSRTRILQLPADDGRKCDFTEFLLPKQDGRAFEIEHPYAGHNTGDILRLMSAAAGKRISSIAESGAAHRAYRAENAGLQTGWKLLDAVTRPGLLPGQVVFLLAKTGVGKSLILCNLAYHMRQYRILFITLEMTREETYHRLERIFLFHHPRATIDELESALVNVWICDENRLGENDLRALVNEYEVEVGATPHLVFVDYLGYYARGARGNSPYEKTSNAAMQLKADAKAGRLVVISPSQVNRMSKDGQPIDLDDARDSGAIEETGDFVLAAWKPDNSLQPDGGAGAVNVQPTNKLKLSVLKSRHGGVGKVISLQMDALTLAIVEDPSKEAKRAEEHNTLAWQGTTWEELRAGETRAEQMSLLRSKGSAR